MTARTVKLITELVRDVAPYAFQTVTELAKMYFEYRKNKPKEQKKQPYTPFVFNRFGPGSDESKRVKINCLYDNSRMQDLVSAIKGEPVDTLIIKDKDNYTDTDNTFGTPDTTPKN